MSTKDRGEQHATDLLQQYGVLARTDKNIHALLAMAYSQGFIDGATVSADIAHQVFDAMAKGGEKAAAAGASPA
jgi:hypothetical protein